eukprot:TRINITY_DN29685_c0_g1_i1.p1 TRINITY_DN29685_c0_g1~~TRINITY_DN29685_c0_g1_i1.p1  ORF type:complete len:498 (-),score=89.57 TRINITY_DN29685_c0_g1_i1:83-1360(-)
MEITEGSHVPKINLDVRERQTLKVKPGLSHFARKDDVEGCKKSIQKLLTFAGDFVRDPSSTPLLLKATAGLRAVPIEKAGAILGAIRSIFKTSSYKFEDQWVDIIKGKEEAGLAWVAANYLRGTFDSGKEHDSVGVIEMGGGSTQVSFEIDKTVNVADNDNFQFTTGLGKTYHLYAHSYLGFGLQYAQKALREKISGVQDPCYPQGYFRVHGREVVNGTGSSTSCGEKIKALLMTAENAPGRYKQEVPIQGPVLATENFFYIRKDLGLPKLEDVEPTPAESSATCSKPLVASAEKVDEMKGGSADPGKPDTCFALSYQLELLSALGAPAAGKVEVKVKHQLKGADIDWALGASLVHVLANPTQNSTEGGAGFIDMMRLTQLVMIVALAALLGLWGRRRFCMSLQASPATSISEPTKYGARSDPLE